LDDGVALASPSCARVHVCTEYGATSDRRNVQFVKFVTLNGVAQAEPSVVQEDGWGLLRSLPVLLI
jgi:hypothetical protein